MPIRRRGFHVLSLLLLLGFVAACAAKRPVLYPNHRLHQVGDSAAQADVDDCLEFAADSGFRANPAGRTIQSATAGSAVGGAVGAASGAVRGNAGRRAATWAAGGAAGGFMRGLLRWRDPDPLQQRFVQMCLGDQGYRVVGWR